MEYNYPKFTPEMKKTHTILIPNMAITQFRLLEYALRYDGYKCEILGNCGSAVAQLGQFAQVAPCQQLQRLAAHPLRHLQHGGVARHVVGAARQAVGPVVRADGAGHVDAIAGAEDVLPQQEHEVAAGAAQQAQQGGVDLGGEV